MSNSPEIHGSDLRGMSRLAFDGIASLSETLETMHGNIAGIRHSEKGLIHLIVAGAKERRQMETQRQIYEKLREMEAEAKARRAQQQHVHHEEKRNRAYYLSITLKRGAAQGLQALCNFPVPEIALGSTGEDRLVQGEGPAGKA